MHRLLSISALMVSLGVASVVPIAGSAYAAAATFTCLRLAPAGSGFEANTRGDVSSEQTAALREQGFTCRPDSAFSTTPTVVCTGPSTAGLPVPAPFASELTREGFTCRTEV